MPLGMLGKYEKLDVLGHGASGIVYLAKDTLLSRQVALKVVNLQAGEMQHFLEEARVLDRLRHPNIVRVHNVDRINGNIVLDMEYVRGKNLQEMLREQGALPWEYALEIIAQTLDALQYAHEMQTVHRDIKPANILISRKGEVKLVDFGLAEILATNAYAGGAGTYAYMAPEDFAEENHSDHQSDIWAVGVTLYEMLAGQRPFLVGKPKDPFSWKRVLDNELPTPLAAYLPNASEDLQAVLNRALAREKSRRYATAAAFRDDVRRLQAGHNPESRTKNLGPNAMDGRTMVAVLPVSPPASSRQRVASHAAAGITHSTPGTESIAKLNGDVAETPDTMQTVPARPAFAQVASWFVPLFASAMLPIAAVLYASNGAHASAQALATYAPAAAAATGLLALMLLLIAVAADIGIAERVSCGIVSAAMGAVLGVSSSRWQPGVFDASMTHTLLTAVPLGGMLFLQLLSLKRWRWWAFVAACTGLAVGIGFFTRIK
jgi:predicted Ser/Thr protein kinase